jgi:hypothetical protein
MWRDQLAQFAPGRPVPLAGTLDRAGEHVAETMGGHRPQGRRPRTILNMARPLACVNDLYRPASQEGRLARCGLDMVTKPGAMMTS